MAITKVTGALVDIGDLDLTNVGTLHLDSIVSDASPAAITVGYGGSDTLTINGLTTMTTDGASPLLTLKSTDAGAGASPILDFVRDSASPADSDALGFIRFKADNDAGEETLLANIKATAVDVSDGTEDGRLLLQTIVNGSNRNRIEITNTEVVVNQSSIDSDFRVESDGDANMLFVDGGNNGVGIGTGSPASPNSVNRFLHIHNADHSSLVMSDDSNTWEIVSNSNLTVRDGTSTRLTVDTSGNVGIGETSPNALLAVGNGNQSHTSVASFAHTTDAYIEVENTTTQNGAGIIFTNAGTKKWTIQKDTSSHGLFVQEETDTTVMAINQGGWVTMPYQPSVMVQLSGDQTNLATTPTTITFDTERFDQNSDFNTSTYTFTAPVTGRYLVCVNLYMKNIDNAASYYQLYVQSSNRTFYSIFDPAGVGSSDPTYWDMQWSGVIDMDASDTVYFRMNQSGGAAQTDLDNVTHASISLLH